MKFFIFGTVLLLAGVYAGAMYTEHSPGSKLATETTSAVKKAASKTADVVTAGTTAGVSEAKK
jgi:hypothetical protein